MPYRDGIPGNGKPVPDGAKIAKVHWKPKHNQFFPDATVPGDLVNVDFMVKDGKRFADSGGWGYAVFDYDTASGSSSPAPRFGSCHTTAITSRARSTSAAFAASTKEHREGLFTAVQRRS